MERRCFLHLHKGKKGGESEDLHCVKRFGVVKVEEDEGNGMIVNANA